MGLKPDTECRECFRRGFTDYVTRAGLSTGNYNEFIRLVDENLDRECPPPIAGADSWALLRRVSLKGSDIFLDEKRDFTRKMLSVYPAIRDEYMNGPEPAKRALGAATWCNLLDVGQGRPLPEPEELVRMFDDPLELDERTRFLEGLQGAENLLVLGDNAGETVIDRLFLELSGFTGNRYYMTRAEPVMNDAIMEDALAAGLDSQADLLSSGTDIPAVVPDLLSGRPLEVFTKADIVLAKGQGNLEGLFGLGDQRVYHSFVVKCPVVSRATGASMGSAVFSRFPKREE